jgi:hypothetical protein
MKGVCVLIAHAKLTNRLLSRKYMVCEEVLFLNEIKRFLHWNAQDQNFEIWKFSRKKKKKASGQLSE